MATYFLDTSALVKLYVAENGSGWLRSIADPRGNHTLVIAAITGAETIAGIARRLRAGSLSIGDASAAMAKFRRDYVKEYSRIQLTRLLLHSAMNLAEKHGLRGYDAVQLAAAITLNNRTIALGLQPITLLSSDTELNTAAAAEGIVVDDPNLHP